MRRLILAPLFGALFLVGCGPAPSPAVTAIPAQTKSPNPAVVGPSTQPASPSASPSSPAPGAPSPGPSSPPSRAVGYAPYELSAQDPPVPRRTIRSPADCAFTPSQYLRDICVLTLEPDWRTIEQPTDPAQTP